MSGVLRRGLLLIGLWSASAVPAAQQEAGRPEQASRPARAHEKLRERMHARPAKERARLERHLEEFEKLPVSKRVKLLERARALRERERAVDTAVPRELRRRLEELEDDQARELWVAHLRERFRERGRELRERLPENVRKRLERAPPEARRRFLERLFQEREPVSRRALERMRERFGLPGAEFQRLQRLPLDERVHAMLEMRKTAPDAQHQGG